MALVSLLTLRTEVRQQSDQVNSLFCTDAELNQYIRNAYASLYGKIVEAFGNDYFVQTPAAGFTFLTDGVNQLFALPAAFFKLLGVEVSVSSGSTQFVSLTPFAFADRNRAYFPNTQIPQAGQTIRVLYVPQPTLPTQDADTINGVNSWEESIIIDACLVAMAKEESDVSVMLRRQAAMKERLDSEIENRNASEHGGRIVDLERRARPGMQYRLNGGNLWLIGGSTPTAGFGYWDNDFNREWGC